MDTLVAIDKLCDVHVAGYRDEGISFDRSETRVLCHSGGEETDHVADGDFGGDGEVLVEAHGDVLGGRFGARPEERRLVWSFLVKNELEGAGELCLHGGD